jgi:hypothetical protein
MSDTINELLSGDPWRTKDKRFQQDDVVKIDDDLYGHTLVSFTYGGHIYCSCDDQTSRTERTNRNQTVT